MRLIELHSSKCIGDP